MKYLDLGTYKFVKQPNQHTKWYQRFWARIVWYTKVAIRLTMLGGLGTALVLSGVLIDRMSKPVHVIAQVLEQPQKEAPIMERIADCESGKRDKHGRGIPGSASHYGPSGQVLMTPNNNGTVDVGKYAVNSVWFKKATELGLDLTVEKDNKAMADWIYANRGTEDWYPSKSCWSK